VDWTDVDEINRFNRLWIPLPTETGRGYGIAKALIPKIAKNRFNNEYAREQKKNINRHPNRMQVE